MFGRSKTSDNADGAIRTTKEDDGNGTILEVILTIGAALLLAFLVQQFLVKPFKIPSGSMENTLKCGDRVLVDRLTWRFTDPKRGDVVVFNPPAGVGENGKIDTSIVAGDNGVAPSKKADGTREYTKAKTNYIKRIIGLPGDKVQVKNQHAYIDGKELKEPYLRPLEEGASDPSSGDFGPVTVPKGTYLMLGDHRDNSADGRVFGFVPRQGLIGKAFMVYWPPARFGGLPTKDPGGASKADPNCIENAAPAGQSS
ncbi:MAG: signal peptidase I [Gaiellales bacterium]